MKKLLALAAAMLVLAGCAGGPSEEEAKEIVAGLVEASYEMNVIYFGEGMPAEADGDNGYVGFYSYLTDDAPYLTEAELRAATLEVYTSNYSRIIFDMFLTGYSDSELGGTIYARYVENGDRLTKKTDYEPLAPKARTYDLENITINKSRAKYITATLTSYVDEVRDEDVEITARLEERETDDGTELVWRLDTPTY